MLLKGTLRGLGIEAVEGGNGREGLETLHANGIVDFVMVDWHMPEMDGREFVEVVRKDAKYAAMPIIMVTSETEMDKITSALEAGANEYIMKPFTKESVIQKLQILGLVKEG